MFNIGTQELLLLLLAVLLLFGAKRVPEVARALGKGMGDLRDALSGVERELKGEPPNRPAGVLPPAPASRPTAVPRRKPPTVGAGVEETPRPHDPEPSSGADSDASATPPAPPGPGESPDREEDPPAPGGIGGHAG